MTSTRAQAVSVRTMLGARRSSLIATAIGAVLLVLAPLGATWLFVPANPAANLPETTLSFSGLGDLTSGGLAPTTGLQASYFAWLGWTLIALTLIVALAALLIGSHGLRVALGVIALVGLVTTILAVKGPMSWSEVVDQLPNVRVGGYLVFGGYLVMIVAAGLPVRTVTTPAEAVANGQ